LLIFRRKNIIFAEFSLSLQRQTQKTAIMTKEERVAYWLDIAGPRFAVEPKVMMFGSYSKGYANPDSDIDVAVIVPTYGDRKHEMSMGLWRDVRSVSFLIEPVLMAEDRWSPLYDDVMRTGVTV
jgi:predicted nucleotidyltransferase